MVDGASVLERAKAFLYKNGRLLDRRRFEYHFEGGSKQAVLDVLRAYQNPDGGFGNALEPDIRCPQSQPVPTEMALQIMDDIDAFDPEIMDGIVRYLREIALPNGGFPLVFRSASDYPHAPWWNAERDDVPSINPTGTIIGMLYKQKANHAIYEEAWFKECVDYIWRLMEEARPDGYHDGIQWLEFLRHTPDQNRARRYFAVVDEWLQSPATIERDPNAQGYVHKVLDWAPALGSYAGKFVTPEELNVHLNAVLEQQHEDGGWVISWPALGPGADAEWRGWLTVERLKTLSSYGKL
ncbi:MAG: hypothetical protein J7559_07590 [Cohnella sp.]|nr:hypothetical protein [Cohnella sp.]